MNLVYFGVLLLIDTIMIAMIYQWMKNRVDPVEILKDVGQEKKELKRLRDEVTAELQQARSYNKQVLEKVSTIAAEIELEVKNYGDLLAKEMDGVVEKLKGELVAPLDTVKKRQVALDGLLKRSEQERKLLQRSLMRAEDLSRFFTEKLPYDEVLKELEDKKYADARFYLSKGMKPQEVAMELGIPESEVALIAAVGT